MDSTDDDFFGNFATFSKEQYPEQQMAACLSWQISGLCGDLSKYLVKFFKVNNKNPSLLS